MLDQRLKDRIDVYLRPHYLEEVHESCVLWETELSGRTRLNVILPRDSCVLCIRDYDHKAKCGFLSEDTTAGLQKSMDHILVVQQPDGAWKVHLIEMKSSISGNKWEEIRQKARASILNIKALAAVLDILVAEYVIYTTYEKLSLHENNPADLATRKLKLGGGWKEDEWDKNQILIRVPKGIKERHAHKGIQMQREPIEGIDTLCGEVTL